MIEVTLWILIAITSGNYNHGTSTVIDRFGSKETCEDARKQLYSDEPTFKSTRWARCIKATVLREKQV